MNPSWRSVGLLAVTFLLLLPALSTLAACNNGVTRSYYVTSESMMPTLLPGERFLAVRAVQPPYRRGDLVLVRTPTGEYIDRVIGVPGDVVEVREGIVILNGEALDQSPMGDQFDTEYGPAHIYEERFPGARSSHLIADAGPSPSDFFSEATVPEAHYFVMGDNRDMAADSRHSPEIGGLGMVPENDIVGQPTQIYWSEDTSRIGTAL
ncbi:MAG: signal peptidase I [Parasphingopyxis sp.]|uniref:signal peptidase I n=1 Tax=Parasphingopyxis sp. TaxID=1920299 RepID=UPI003F9F867C